MSVTLADQCAVYFEIPATDPLGRMHIVGKFLAAEKSASLFWKRKDNEFAANKDEMQEIKLDYANIESLQLKLSMGLWKPRLILKIADPAPMTALPGADVGKVTLHLSGKNAKQDARKMIKMLDYRKSDAEATARMERLSTLHETP